MHLAVIPSRETEHQSGFLQIGQGDLLVTRAQLLLEDTALHSQLESTEFGVMAD
jgi:hypothetical protein